MKYIIISKKKWNKENYKNLNKSFKFFTELKINRIKKISPRIIFFIHWSKKIPSKIFKNYLCIQFHSSNLPKFKGGSPIQNQILRNIKKTKITAFKVTDKIDSGDICLKKNLNLSDSAHLIYSRMENICISMIKSLTRKKKIKFYKQKGISTYFRRRVDNDSDLSLIKSISIKKIFDFIRMLDAPGYPKAFIKFKNFKVELYDAKLNSEHLNAKIKISTKL